MKVDEADKDINVTVTAPSITNGAVVGDSQFEDQKITVHQTVPSGSTQISSDSRGTAYKLPDGTMIYYQNSTKLYFTLLPVRSVGNETTDYIKNQYINTDWESKDDGGNISFLDEESKDNDNDDPFADPTEEALIAIGLRVTDDGVREAGQSEEFTHVGIAVSKNKVDEKLADALVESGANVQVMTVNVYYTPIGSSSGRFQKHIVIEAIKP